MSKAVTTFFVELKKANPFKDKLGRFASKPGGGGAAGGGDATSVESFGGFKTGDRVEINIGPRKGFSGNITSMSRIKDLNGKGKDGAYAVVGRGTESFGSYNIKDLTRGKTFTSGQSQLAERNRSATSRVTAQDRALNREWLGMGKK